MRTIQDFYVKYSLTSAKGVAEVASIGGFVKEYQVDIDPNAMKAHGLNISQIMAAVKNSNLDIGARTIEFNRVEYLVRALGYITDLEDLEKSVVAVKENFTIRFKDVAKINYGPATSRGGLDKGGSEAVGGVVVARYGANHLQKIDNVKEKIKEIATVRNVSFIRHSPLNHFNIGLLIDIVSTAIESVFSFQPEDFSSDRQTVYTSSGHPDPWGKNFPWFRL